MSDLPTGSYACIVADPPWPQRLTGGWRARHRRARALPYEAMTVAEIAALPVEPLAQEGTHLWLWTTNSHLRDAFTVMEVWGFTYLTTVTWTKPNGLGAYFIHTTQHVLFGYYRTCRFPLGRYKPTHFTAPARRHSEKPDVFYDLVRSISPGPRIDLFNRRVLTGFDGWGDESPMAQQPSLLEGVV